MSDATGVDQKHSRLTQKGKKIIFHMDKNASSKLTITGQTEEK